MRVPFEFIGVGLAWLWGWMGGMADAADLDTTNWLDHCIRDDYGIWASEYALTYYSSPDCLKLDPNDKLSLNSEGGRIPKKWIQYWRNVLERGAQNFSNNHQLMAMLNHCHQVTNPVLPPCPFDLEKDSLPLALAASVKHLKVPRDLIRNYSMRLKAITESTTEGNIKSLFETANSDEFGYLFKISIDDLNVMLNDLLFINSFLCNFGDLNEGEIMKKVTIWKSIIDKQGSPAATKETLCAENQLRHFLYSVLRCQLFASNYLDLPNTSIGHFSNFQISGEQKQVIGSLLDLKVYDLIKNKPIEAAVGKIYQVLKDANELDWWTVWDDKVASLKDILFTLRNVVKFPGYTAVTVGDTKQWADTLDVMVAYIDYILDSVAQLKTKLTPSFTASPDTSASIHDCVDYLVATPNPNIPTFNHIKTISQTGNSPESELNTKASRNIQNEEASAPKSSLTPYKSSEKAKSRSSRRRHNKSDETTNPA
ncbi:hypothetical protein NEHOM01_1973 [Nematocida homosporus]|uniref:uncharacterized protein n=1 Tax=Nematocida homosporus TaxID=1912981 RepID=UPI00222024A0|nr:uncharacterized protein NEHOM01_1973 [Nematocida homosporus]KAI5187157.1 hypothetical protein NEHOM01_1973 [Nematocida homosporus]